MTGIYVRIKRAGKWQSIEFDQLTDDEMEAFVRSKPGNEEVIQEGWRWAIALAKIIQKLDITHAQ